MNRNFWTFIAVCAAGAFALVLLTTWRTAPQAGIVAAPTMALRVHDVPPARVDDIKEALSVILSMGDGQPPLGRVTKGSQGQLLVLAPESVQTDVARTLASLGGSTSKSFPVETVVFDLWFVDAIAGAGADDTTLAPIAAALDAARPALGKVVFRREDAVSTMVRADDSVVTVRTEKGLGGDVFLRSVDGGVGALIILSDPGFRTSLDLRFEEVAIISRMTRKDGSTRLLVARVRPAHARA